MRITSVSNYNDHTNSLLKQFKILKFIDLVEFYNALFIYDYFNDQLPKTFKNFFVKVNIIHSYNTRLVTRQTYYLPPARTNYGKFSIRINGVKIWNSIKETDKKLFRKTFKKKFTRNKITAY